MSQVPSRHVGAFWEGVYSDIAEFLKDTSPEVAEVGAMSLGSARVTARGETYDAAAELLPVVSLYPPVTGDAVLIVKLADGSEIVVGAIADAAEPSPISQAQADALYLPLGSYFIPRGDGNFFQGATAATNNSTSTWATSIGISFASMPPGTYTAIVKGGGIFKHTVAAGNMDIRARANTGSETSGQIKAVKVHDTANTEMCVNMSDAITGIVRASTGVIDIDLQYRANTAGTVSARNAFVSAILYRTA